MFLLDVPQATGIEIAIVVPIITLFGWFVRGAIRSQEKALSEHSQERKELARAQQDVTREFVEYLKESGTKQTEVLVSVANTLQASQRRQEEHDRRAQERHDEAMRELKVMRDVVKGGSK